MIASKIGIYLLTNLVNKKIYVGKSVNLQNRMWQHRAPSSDKELIDKAIKKYGWHNFELTILESFEEISNDNLLSKESEWIKKLNSNDLSIGYNLLSYGTDRTGIPCSQEVKQKISEANTGKFQGENHPMYGRKHSAESIEKMRQSHKKSAKYGSDNHAFGKKKSAATIAKIKLAIKSGSHDNLKRKVNQIDLKSGSIIKTWDSLADAAKHFGCSYNQISQVCSGYKRKSGAICKSAKGYSWKFV